MSEGEFENESRDVFGWLYSDNATMWPNNDTLFVKGSYFSISSCANFVIGFSEFPETLMISSENGAGNYQLTTMGLYKKVKGMRRNGLPVWKHLFVENYVSYICK